MELTQEYFDSVVKNLATKDDLKEQTVELKRFAVEQTEELARIIASAVAEPMQKHFDEPAVHEDIEAKVQELEQDVVKIRTALHLPA